VLTEARVIYRLLSNKPIFVGFNVTNRCTMRCTFCSVPSLPHEDMTLPQIERVLDRLKELGIPVVGITGGEPFLRKDLAGIVQAISDRGMKTTIVTNGDLLTRERMEELASFRNIHHFALSVDSLDSDVYSSLRGRDHLPQLLQRYMGLLRYGPKTIYKLNVTVGPENVDEVDTFVDFAEDTGLALSFIPMNIGPGGLHRGNEYSALTEESRRKIASAFRRLRRYRIEGRPLWDHRDFYLFASRYIQGEPMGECYAGQLFLDLRSNGELAFCNEMPAFVSLLDYNRFRLSDLVSARREWEGRIKACRRDSACCYTCSYNVTATALNLPAYIWDYLRFKVR
jgi:MoaA/NifB/PqqE/SkfB family radical SAM enzyme